MTETNNQMMSLYSFLESNNYFWNRVNENQIYVALNGYKCFDERYIALEQQIKQAQAYVAESKFDRHSGKTFYYIKHK